MLAPDGAFERSVFLNCPFDVAYEACFEALVFSVLACGFHPRCALEALDSGAAQLERISRIIRGCLHGGSPERILTVVRDWLRIHSDCPVPGPVTLRQAFAEFSAGLPAVCAVGGLDRHDLQFADYVALAREWVAR